VLQVLGEKDDGHSPVTELALDSISLAQRRRELLEGIPWARPFLLGFTRTRVNGCKLREFKWLWRPLWIR
jgi:hypothetical protein